jgi:transcriptional regulator with GAF, ATPase, and Fis domain
VVLKAIAPDVGAGARTVFACLRDAGSPHLPAIAEVVDDAGEQAWLVTRFVEGESLAPGPASLVRVLDEAVGVAHALASLHAAGTHHSDVAPGNVVVGPAGQVVLTDLGSLGARGFGTPGFIAPECLRGGGGPAADMFSLGCMMLWRLSGHAPWPTADALSRLLRVAQVRARVSELLDGLSQDLPRTLKSLVVRLLHPDPQSRVHDAKTLLPVLLRLRERCTSDGSASPLTSWWPPARWPLMGSLRETVEGLGRRLARGEGPKLVLVCGPTGSGRGRVVEELVAVAQQSGDPMSVETPEDFDRGGDGGLGEPGQWLERWLAPGSGARVRACGEEPKWPARFAASGEPSEDLEGLRAAVLLAGARLGEGARILVVSPRLASLVAQSEAAEIEVLELRPLDRGELGQVLADVVEGPNSEAWIEALYESSGGWPAQVVRYVRACASASAQDPRVDMQSPGRDEALGDMSDAEARAVLARAWGASVRPPATWAHGGGVLPWAVAEARRVLGPGLSDWAGRVSSTLAQEGVSPGLALSIQLGDSERLRDLIGTRAVEDRSLESSLVEWALLHVSELGPDHRVPVIEQLLARGRTDEALTLCEGAQGRTAPRMLALRIRALQRLGRATEALDMLGAGARVLDDDQLRGLRWRALVDLGRTEEAKGEVERWWRSSGAEALESAPVRSCGAALWGALVLLGGQPEFAEDMLIALETRLENETSRMAAGLRARAWQLRGNLAHLRSDPQAVRHAYSRARAAFEEAGEGSAGVWIDGSICALAVPAGELGTALTHGRRSVRNLLARAEVQALPGAVWNFVEALLRVEAFDEAAAMVEAASRLCRAADVGRGELLVLEACALQLELQRAVADGDQPALREAASGLSEIGTRLGEAGHAREACASWLHAAAVRRVLRQPEASKRNRGLASELAERQGDDALLLECALEGLDYIRTFKAGPAWGSALEDAASELTAFADPPALRRQGQLELALRYDRSLYRALFRLRGPADPACKALRRRAFDSLEQMMSKTPIADRPALRSTALNDHGDRGGLSELLQGLVEDSSEAVPAASGGGRSADGAAARAVPGRDERASQLMRMYRRLAREDDLERLLASVCDLMMELTDAERGVVVVRAGDATHEVLREFSNEHDAPSFSRSVIERVFEEGEPVLSVDASEDARFDGSHSISHLNLRSVVAVPLRFRGKLLGAAYVDHRLRRGAFGEEHLSLMEDFGDLAALAVAQTRALTEARQRAEDLAKSQEALEAQLDERDAEVIGLREQVRSRRDDREAYRGMVGKAPAMQKLYRLIDRLSGSDVPVVIHGESGTGKELVARALHEAGPRAAKPFVAENCGAIPESLLESLFFGHARGAFTGANSAKAGLIEAADGGTIFLDEIGEMSMAMQTKLLRVLQEGEVRRVGETRTRKVDVRVVAASNRDLEAMVECGAFRRDLFYRINVVRLELPALRERREDIAALVEHFARAHGRADIQVSARAMRQLMRYPWPGNVRELENEVQRWIALVEDKVRPDDLARAIAGAQGEVDDPDDLALKPRVDRLERELIARALDRTGGNQTHAAELLGLSRYGLQKKLKRLNEAKATT